MPHFITLVTLPSMLTQPIVDRIPSIIKTSDLSWLSQNEALDIPIPEENEKEAKQIFNDLRALFANDKIDIFLTHSEHRRKKLLIADMDSTIVQSETLDDLAQEVGIGEHIAAITKKAMNGELVFADALNERIALLKGVSTDLLEKTWQHTHLNEGAKTLVATMKIHKAHTALVSGGFTFFTQKVTDACGFDENHANQFSITDNKLNGKVIAPILGKEAKLFHLNRLVQELGITLNESMTIGDGANDLPMLTMAGLGIGYYPKPIVTKQILNIIQHTSLLSALFMQGYNRAEFVSN